MADDIKARFIYQEQIFGLTKRAYQTGKLARLGPGGPDQHPKTKGPHMQPDECNQLSELVRNSGAEDICSLYLPPYHSWTKKRAMGLEVDQPGVNEVVVA
jgi:hypothetical protein